MTKSKVSLSTCCKSQSDARLNPSTPSSFPSAPRKETPLHQCSNPRTVRDVHSQSLTPLATESLDEHRRRQLQPFLADAIGAVLGVPLLVNTAVEARWDGSGISVRVHAPKHRSCPCREKRQRQHTLPAPRRRLQHEPRCSWKPPGGVCGRLNNRRPNKTIGWCDNKTRTKANVREQNSMSGQR